MRVGEIAEAVGIAQSTASVHLRRLLDDEFVLVDRSGTSSWFLVNAACIEQFPQAADQVMGTLVGSIPLPDDEVELEAPWHGQAEAMNPRDCVGLAVRRAAGWHARVVRAAERLDDGVDAFHRGGTTASMGGWQCAHRSGQGTGLRGDHAVLQLVIDSCPNQFAAKPGAHLYGSPCS
jgi:hypothetical protein